MNDKSLCVAISALVLFLAYEFVPAFSVVSKKPKNLPRAVRLSAWLEVFFGLLVFFSWFFVFLPVSAAFESRLLKIVSFPGLIFLASLLFLMSARLSQGCRHSRKACLIVSVIRLPTVVGIPFSIASIYLLYVNKQSCRWFADKQYQEES